MKIDVPVPRGWEAVSVDVHQWDEKGDMAVGNAYVLYRREYEWPAVLKDADFVARDASGCLHIMTDCMERPELSGGIWHFSGKSHFVSKSLCELLGIPIPSEENPQDTLKGNPARIKADSWTVSVGPADDDPSVIDYRHAIQGPGEYVTRDGRRAVVDDWGHSGKYPWVGTIGGNHCSWSVTGKYSLDVMADDRDIVACVSYRLLEDDNARKAKKTETPRGPQGEPCGETEGPELEEPKFTGGTLRKMGGSLLSVMRRK